MRVYKTPEIRNVAVVGHGASGKTSLVDALAFVAGTSKRHGAVKDGTALTDYTPDEIERKYSINLALAVAEWMDTKLNLIDTPGYLDFTGEALAGVYAADGAVVVVSATGGVEVGTEKVWDYCEGRGIPRLFFVSLMDKEHAGFERVYEQIKRQLTPKVIPVEIPVGEGPDFHGIINLFSKKCHLYKKGTKAGEYEEVDVPAEYGERFERYSKELIERIAETDDTLLERYLGGEEIGRDEAVAGRKAEPSVRQRREGPLRDRRAARRRHRGGREVARHAHERHAIHPRSADRAPQDPVPGARHQRGDRGEAARRGGEAVERPAQAARGGPHVPARVQRGAAADADTRAGRAASRDHRGPAGPEVRRARRDHEAESRLSRDVPGEGRGPGEAQEADRQPRPVRRLPDPHRTAAPGLWVAIRGRDRRRRDPAPVHPGGGARHPGGRGTRPGGGVSGGGLQGGAVRRLLSRRRLQRDVVQDGRHPGVPEREPELQAGAARADPGSRSVDARRVSGCRDGRPLLTAGPHHGH